MSLPLNPSNGDVYTNSLGTKWKYSTVNNQWRIYALEGVTGLQGATGMAGATGPAVAHGVTVGYVPYASGATGWGTSNIASSETGTTVYGTGSTTFLIRDGVTGTVYSTVAAYNSNDYVGYKIKRDNSLSGVTGSDNTWYLRMPQNDPGFEIYDGRFGRTVMKLNDAGTPSVDFYGAGTSAFLVRDTSATNSVYSRVYQAMATGMEAGNIIERNVTGGSYNAKWKLYLAANDKNLHIKDGLSGLSDLMTFDATLSDVYTKAWQGYSGSVTGISGSPISYSVYTKKFGRMVDVQFSISGNSNSTIFAFDLPYTNNADIPMYSQSVSTDLNTLQTSPGRPYIATSSNICRVGKNNTGSEGWTVTGIKGIDGSFFYQANA